MVQGKIVIIFNANDALYLYIKNESKRYGLSQTGFMNYMLSKVLSNVPKEDIMDYELIPISPKIRVKFNQSGGHSMYLSVKESIHDKLTSIIDSGPGRESLSKCVRVLLVKYIDLKKEGVF